MKKKKNFNEAYVNTVYSPKGINYTWFRKTISLSLQ